MPNDVFLSSGIRRSRFLKLQDDCDREAIANFFVERFTERFVDPVEATSTKAKHGFAIMALSCLLVETLESFWCGWSSTEGKSQLAFCQFVSRSPRFHSLLGHVPAFYKHVRCGILHQAETTGGWRIWRRGPLFDPARLTINATTFHRALQAEIKHYASLLRTEPWGSNRWLMFQRKMAAICANSG